MRLRAQRSGSRAEMRNERVYSSTLNIVVSPPFNNSSGFCQNSLRGGAAAARRFVQPLYLSVCLLLLRMEQVREASFRRKGDNGPFIPISLQGLPEQIVESIQQSFSLPPRARIALQPFPEGGVVDPSATRIGPGQFEVIVLPPEDEEAPWVSSTCLKARVRVSVYLTLAP